MGEVGEGAIKGVIPLRDHGRGIHIERGTVFLSEFGKRNVVAIEHKMPAAAQDAALDFAIGERRWTSSGKALLAGGHFFLDTACEPARTRIATTVWSSNVSTPAECSATALKRVSTTQAADCSLHSPISFSTRPRPNSSPLRLRASRMPSLKNTNISPGFMRK